MSTRLNVLLSEVEPKNDISSPGIQQPEIEKKSFTPVQPKKGGDQPKPINPDKLSDPKK